MGAFRSHVGVVFKKELLDGIRDRRSVLSALGLPILAPFMIIFLFNTMASREEGAADVPIPVVGGEFAPDLLAWMERQNYELADGPDDPETAVRDGDYDFVVVIDEDYAKDMEKGRPATVQVVTDGSRQEAAPVVRRLRGLIQGYGRAVASMRLVARGISPSLNQPIDMREVDVASSRKRSATLLGMIPLFVIMVAFVGGSNLAIDVTAGERERGSLEPLLINPVSRTAIVIGKWLVTALFATLGILVITASMVFAVGQVSFEELGLRVSLGPTEVVVILATVIPLAFLASGLQILVATFARSFKEAQMYISMLIFLPIIPGFFATVASIPRKTWMSPIPGLGHQVLLTDVVAGLMPGALDLIIAGVSSLALGLVCVGITARLFQHERIVFGR